MGFNAALDHDPNFFKHLFRVSDFEETFQAIREQKVAEKKEWGIQFLDLLDQQVGAVFLNAYKHSAFVANDEANETKDAWVATFRKAQSLSEASYSNSEREFLGFLEQVFETTPINHSTIGEHIAAYNDWMDQLR